MTTPASIISPTHCSHLHQRVVSQLIAADEIISLDKIVEELTMNSIHAMSTSIIVSMDLEKCSILVEDNGKGIDGSTLIQMVGEDNTETARVSSVSTYSNKVNTLVAIRHIARDITIQSRTEGDKSIAVETWMEGEKIKVQNLHEFRPHGTTVIVNDIFHYLPVRKLSIVRETTVMNIDRFLRSISVLHHYIDYYLYLDGKCIRNLEKHRSVWRRITSIHCMDMMKCMTKTQFQPQKSTLRIEGFLSSPQETNCQERKDCQYAYLNHHVLQEDSPFLLTLNTLYALFLTRYQKQLPTESGKSSQKKGKPSGPQPKHSTSTNMTNSATSNRMMKRICPCFVLQITCCMTQISNNTLGIDQRTTTKGSILIDEKTIRCIHCQYTTTIQSYILDWLRQYGKENQQTEFLTFLHKAEEDEAYWDISNTSHDGRNRTSQWKGKQSMTRKQEMIQSIVPKHMKQPEKKPRKMFLQKPEFPFRLEEEEEDTAANPESNDPYTQCTSADHRLSKHSFPSYLTAFQHPHYPLMPSFQSIFRSSECPLLTHPLPDSLIRIHEESEDAQDVTTAEIEPFISSSIPATRWTCSSPVPAPNNLIPVQKSIVVSEPTLPTSTQTAEAIEVVDAVVEPDILPPVEDTSLRRSCAQEEIVNTFLSSIPYQYHHHNTAAVANTITNTIGTTNKNIPSEVSRTFQKLDFRSLQSIGQMDEKLLIAYSPALQLLLAFDQHAVDERIRYEQYSLAGKDTLQIAYFTPFPTICLTDRMKSIVQQRKALLHDWLIEYSITANHRDSHFLPATTEGASSSSSGRRREEAGSRDYPWIMTVYSTVIYLQEKLTVDDIAEFVDYLVTHTTVPNHCLEPPAIRRILASKACRSAIKFGDTLTNEECAWYIHQLGETANPFQCAHGRPTLSPIATIFSSSIQPSGTTD